MYLLIRVGNFSIELTSKYFRTGFIGLTMKSVKIGISSIEL